MLVLTLALPGAQQCPRARKTSTSVPHKTPKVGQSCRSPNATLKCSMSRRGEAIRRQVDLTLNR